MADVEDNDLRDEDAARLESDISNLGGYKPYDWQPGEIGEGIPLNIYLEWGIYRC